MVVLYVMQRYKTHQLANPANWHNRPKSDTGQPRNSNLIVAKEKRENEYLYVFGNLLSQGLIKVFLQQLRSCFAR
jgi:hypothetical protein